MFLINDPKLNSPRNRVNRLLNGTIHRLHGILPHENRTNVSEKSFGGLLGKLTCVSHASSQSCMQLLKYGLDQSFRLVLSASGFNLGLLSCAIISTKAENQNGKRITKTVIRRNTEDKESQN